LSFGILLSSSVIGGLIAGFISLRNSERKIQIENITQERAKWREKIRLRSIDIHRASMTDNVIKIAELRLELALNFNPFDERDNQILLIIEKLKKSENREEKLCEFSDRIALLLKHDWERAKYEATKPWFHFFRWQTPNDVKNRKILL
jgi:hypothetical protein